MKGFIFTPIEASDYFDGFSPNLFRSFFQEEGIFVSAVRLSLDFIKIDYDVKNDGRIDSETEQKMNEWADQNDNIIIILYPMRSGVKNRRKFSKMITTIAEEKFGALKCFQKASPIILTCDCSMFLLNS